MTNAGAAALGALCDSPALEELSLSLKGAQACAPSGPNPPSRKEAIPGEREIF